MNDEGDGILDRATQEVTSDLTLLHQDVQVIVAKASDLASS